ncbi:MAG: hypothetical protein IJ668_05945 [Selenomonadaceae bacterium]|nr:hypothetical protein [Selenomonadaceae bacterium]MBR1580022.1 hypothetical protein [Selenomonadaceae bacterium]
MADQLRNERKEIIEQFSSVPEKMRRVNEVSAQYNQKLEQYKQLNYTSSKENRDQRLMIYAEIKILGWILGKSEKEVLKALNQCVAGNPLGVNAVAEY